MRLKIRDGEVGALTGGRVTGPLHLFRDPLLPLEGVTKRYVDAIPNNLSASLITSGTLRNNMLPAWNGEVTTTAGGRVITIKNTVAANTYQSVNVNTKGLVVGGGPLVVGDIPNLNWSKISKGRPTSLAGYGITDGVNLNGGSLTGSLVLSRQPVLNNEVSTKKYSDDIGMLTSLNTGDIIRKITNVTPTGFLKCNGGLVDKEMYADLYAVVGDKFNNYVTPGSGKPWKQQYFFNIEKTPSRLDWRTETPLPGVLAYAPAIVTKNRVYLLGGFNNNTDNNRSRAIVYTAPINEDGTLGDWTTGTSLPASLASSQAIVTKNRVYLLGGYVYGSSGSIISTVYTAPINEDGTLGTWTKDTSLPGGLASSQAIVTKNRVYLLGGRNSSTVYSAPIDSEGVIGDWATDTSLPEALQFSQAVVTSNRVYLLGGWNVSTVYTAPINEDGTLGDWTTATSLPGPLGMSQAVVISNRVYLLGGRTLSTVYTAPINEDGTLGTWTTDTSLPRDLGDSQAVVTSSRVYLLGGHVRSSGSEVTVNTVYSASLGGGVNDYSEFYNGTSKPLDKESDFMLPNLNPTLQSNANYFIKY